MRALENADRIREGAGAPTDREPSGSNSGMAAAVWLRTTVKAPAGAADGGHPLSHRGGEDGPGSGLPDQRKPIGRVVHSRGEFRAPPARLRPARPPGLTEPLAGEVA